MRPFRQLALGGRRQDSFPLYIAVPLGAPEEMVSYVKARAAEGVHKFQLKIGDDPVTDARRTAAVVAATGEDDVVVADANGGWRLQDGVVAARLLQDLPRVYLEQPCATMEECLVVRQRTTLPMVLDEVISDVQTCSFMNDWTKEHVAGYQPRSVGGYGQAPTGPGLGVEVDVAMLGQPLAEARL